MGIYKEIVIDRIVNMNTTILFDKCGALRDLVPFIQFKQREKKPIEECFSRFLNCTNDTKSRKASQADILATHITFLDFSSTFRE